MKWTEKFNEKNTMVNLKVSKIIGLYQILDPNRPQLLLGYNIFHLIFAFLIVYETILLTFCTIGIFYWITNISQVVLQVTFLSNFSFVCYKVFIIIQKRDDLRKCIEVACKGFLKFRHYKTTFFKTFRSRSITLTNVYVLVGNLILLIWSLTPFIFVNSYVILKNPDGIWESYHLIAFNIFFPVSNDVYNRFFFLFHVFEMLMGFVFVLFAHIFDFLLISMCYAITSHMETIGEAYVTLGQKYTAKINFDANENKKHKLKFLNDLKMIIMDHGRVFKKMKDFYNIIRLIIVYQIINASITVSFLIFITILNWYSGRIEEYVQTVKICFAYPYFLVQLFLTCYLFECINQKKDVINFALYKTKWEEMDVECQKLILMAMRMNNAHKMYMKMTATKIVNLEMFTSALHMSYSILSILVNSNLKKSRKL